MWTGIILLWSVNLYLIYWLLNFSATFLYLILFMGRIEQHPISQYVTANLILGQATYQLFLKPITEQFSVETWKNCIDP